MKNVASFKPPNHFDAYLDVDLDSTYHPRADADPDSYLMSIQIRGSGSGFLFDADADADPVPTIHPMHPDPSFP